MYIVVIAWIYVTLMMAVAEATNTTGTLLGAVITFVLYGLLPAGLVAYIMGAPGRRRVIKAREAAENAARREALEASAASGASALAPESAPPDEGGEAAAAAVAPVREKP